MRRITGSFVCNFTPGFRVGLRPSQCISFDVGENLPSVQASKRSSADLVGPQATHASRPGMGHVLTNEGGV
jgi:hypothetical protein